MATSEQLAIIPDVPRIMREMNWPVAAHLMETWQSGSAHEFCSSESEPHRRHVWLSSIRMDWVLSFPRALAVFNTLFNQGPLARLDTWRLLISILSRGHYANSTSGRFDFLQGHPREIETRGHLLSFRPAGTLLRQHAPGVADWRTPQVNIPRLDVEIPARIPLIGGRRGGIGGQTIPSYPVGNAVDQASQVVTMDDLTGALARFQFCVTARGNYERRNGRLHSIEVQELGVWIRDSFDFCDSSGVSQPLGAWRSQPPGSTFAPRNLIPNSDWVWLDNAAFRTWRQRTGNGRDFIVYSDIRRVVMEHPIRITFE